MDAVSSIVRGQGAIPGPNGNYRFFVPGDQRVEGDGGTMSRVLVVIGHGSPNSLSSCKTWAEYRESVGERIDWKDKTTVYLASCSLAGEDGSQFLHGNIANEVKATFPNATVWASSVNVGSHTQSGDWHRL